MKSKNYNQLDVLLRQKSYQQLTADELQFVIEQLGDEKSYDDLKELVMTARQSQSMLVKSSLKLDLVSQFKAKHLQSIPFIWMGYKMPAYVNVLLVVVAIIAVWFLKPVEQVVTDRPVIVQLPGKLDTLVIQSPADTVFIVKRIRVEVPVYITKTAEATHEALTKVIEGNSMRDQQGLRDLLVSGE